MCVLKVRSEVKLRMFVARRQKSIGNGCPTEHDITHYLGTITWWCVYTTPAKTCM